MSKLCDYGCGDEAQFYYKTVDKWCCSKYVSQCPAIKHQMSKKYKGKKRSKEIRDKISVACKGRLVSDETKNKLSIAGKGRKGYWTGKKLPEYMVEKLKGKRNTISVLNKKYPFFSKIEEMRYNPDKPDEKEIQVHCKNHNCPNSKEQGGWFTPSDRQIIERSRQLEHPEGNGGSYFYCSDKCKQECPLFKLTFDPFKNSELLYTYTEYQTWREEVLKRDNYECQKCGCEENLNVHHIEPVKLKPEYSLDPSNGITLCDSCHYEIGHKNECSYINLANKICI